MDIFFLSSQKSQSGSPHSHGGELQVRAKLQNPDPMRFRFLCLLLVFLTSQWEAEQAASFAYEMKEEKGRLGQEGRGGAAVGWGRVCVWLQCGMC